MGWFGSSSKDDSGVKKTEGGAFESPSRSNRKQCYAARDAFFECLDKNNILDSINSKSGRDKAASFCGQFDQEFEKNCAHSWVRGISERQQARFTACVRSWQWRILLAFQTMGLLGRSCLGIKLTTSRSNISRSSE
jgi:cytochrome c oxidase assembly factor 6